MRNANTRSLFWTAVAILLLSGCASQEPRLAPAVDNSHPRAKLILGSIDLRGTVELHNPIFRKLGQLTQSQVELVNYSNETIDIEYRIDWMDAAGFQVATPGSWQFATISGNGSQNLTAMGKTPEAYKITVTVRLPDVLFDSEPDPSEYEDYPLED